MSTTARVVLLFVAVNLLSAVGLAQTTVDGASTSANASVFFPSHVADSPEPSAMPAPPPKARRPTGIGVGVRLSLLGIGGEVAVPATRRTNVRGGVNLFGYSRGFSKDGINYAADLNFRSAEVHLDWFPFVSRFHLSPGLMVYNGNSLSASASVVGGQAFTLGGTRYVSEAADPVTGSGKIQFNKVAPTFMLGFGNLVPRNKKRLSVNVEAGLAFQGSPQASLSLRGTACDPTGLNCRNAATDPTVQASLMSEQGKINHDLSPFKLYPIISLGFGYKF